MRRLLPLCLLALASGAASAQERPAKALPALGKAPKVDGVAKDCSGLALKSAATEGASASFTARVGWRKDTLFVCMEAKDNAVTEQDAVTLSLFFPGAGPTASGHVFHFGLDGKRASPPDSGTPAFAQKRVEAGVRSQDNTLALEVALPVRAFPRFPAAEPLVFDLCLTFKDVSNCKGGGMVGEALRLPDDFRKGLKLKPPADVVALEAQAGGWLGYGVLHYPAWVEADARLTPGLLRTLVTPKAVSAEQAGVNVPEPLSLPDGRPLLVVLSGESPYTADGKCDSDKELRRGLYLVKGKTAQRVLEWPAATCALGRATSVVLDEEGALSIGYSNGPTINFAWSGDHFERTELGKR